MHGGREGQRVRQRGAVDESRQLPWDQQVPLWEARAGAARTCTSAQPEQRCMGVLAYGPRCLRDGEEQSINPSIDEHLEGTHTLNRVSAVSRGQRLMSGSFSVVPLAVPSGHPASNQRSFQ